MRPGPGWKQLNASVWERIHLLGMIRLPNMIWLSEFKFPESRDANKFIRANGGNRKRGLMAWAMAVNNLQ